MDCHEDVCRDTIKLPKFADSLEATVECPPDRSELGKAAWVLMHSAAAYSPEVPSSTQQQTFLELYQRIASTYPCRECAGIFQEEVKKDPPRVSSRRELSVWVCQLHNKINLHLGKTQFPCSLEALDKRWRKGPAECYGTLNDETAEFTY